MTDPQSIVGIRRLKNGKIECTDWRGNAIEVSVEDMGSHCLGLLNDPELPNVEVLTAGHASLVEVGTRLLLPESLREYSGPMVALMEHLWKQVNAPRTAPAPPTPPNSPSPSSETQDPHTKPRARPRRTRLSRRRGHMVGG